jgi:hypothetical protein
MAGETASKNASEISAGGSRERSRSSDSAVREDRTSAGVECRAPSRKERAAALSCDFRCSTAYLASFSSLDASHRVLGGRGARSSRPQALSWAARREWEEERSSRAWWGAEEGEGSDSGSAEGSES